MAWEVALSLSLPFTSIRLDFERGGLSPHAPYGVLLGPNSRNFQFEAIVYIYKVRVKVNTEATHTAKPKNIIIK